MLVLVGGGGSALPEPNFSLVADAGLRALEAAFLSFGKGSGRAVTAEVGVEDSVSSSWREDFLGGGAHSSFSKRLNGRCRDRID
jgi:hypothetical protein